MYLWSLLVILATWTEALTYWEPCKVQCDKNFRRNDVLIQTPLMTVCKRGCDLFTVALISTTQDEHPHHTKLLRPVRARNTDGQRASSHQPSSGNRQSVTQKLLQFTTSGKNDGEVIKKVVPVSFVSEKSPSMTGKVEESNKVTYKSKDLGDYSSKEVTQTHSPSKTTVVPASQPVQDHPVEAGKQTTTTNGPKQENRYKTSVKETKTTGSHLDAIPQKSNDSEPKDATPALKDGGPPKEIKFEARLEQAKHSCRHACVAAYGGAAELEACVVGCQLQATTAALRPNEKLSSADKLQHKSPMALFQHVVFSLASNVGRLVRVSWSWASTSTVQHQESPTDKVQVYGTEGLTPGAEVPMFIGLRQSYNIAEPPKRPEVVKVETIQGIHGVSLLNDMFHLPRPIDNAIPVNRHQNMPDVITVIKEEMEKDFHPKAHHEDHSDDTTHHKKHNHRRFEKIEEVLDIVDVTDKKSEESRSNSDHLSTQQTQLDLLECISRKSGLPRWFIAIAIFVSALVVLWLCFSLTAPPDDIKVVKTKPPEFECCLDDEGMDSEDDDLSCSDKKKLLARADDVIKISIENV